MNTILRIALVAFALSATSVAMTSCKKSNYEEKLRLEMEARLEREREQMQSQQAAAQTPAAQAPAAQPAAKPAASSASGANATVIQEGGYTNVRSGAGSNYSIVEKIKDGSPIRVGRNVGGWYEVLNAQGGLRGYMHASKVVMGGQAAAAPAPRGAKLSVQDLMTVVVKPEGGYTNVRQGPGTSYGIVTKVRDGSDIFCNGTDFNTASWVKVYDLNMNFLGYISRNKLIAR